MVSSLEESDSDGPTPLSASASTSTRMDTLTDPAVSTNKHLTRLVRFSILQARRSSKNANNGANNDNRPPVADVATTSPHRHVVAPTKYPFAFGADKERPSTEVPYAYSNAPQGLDKHGRGGIGGAVVAVPADPPIIEDLSASLTLSAGEQSYSGETISDEHHDLDDDDHDMDLLLAPDSGEAMMIMNQLTNSSSEVYDSTEMYSSSGYYDGGSNSSCASSDSSDSIMRRVEQEIANARKASSEAQARLAYFTQKQKDLAPIMTDSYSFDFLEKSGDLRRMLDVSADGEDPHHQHQHRHPRYQIQQQPSSPKQYSPQRPRIPWSPTRSYGSIHEDAYKHNATGHTGKNEFDTNTADVQEKVDIEVILAPSLNSSNSYPNNNNINARNSNHSNLVTQPAPSKDQNQITSSLPSPDSRRASSSRRIAKQNISPRQLRRDEDSVDIDEAVISAVFSEKSIESLPVRGSLQDLFSEPSMDSLPNQPTPASYSFQDTSYEEGPSFLVSPSHNLFPKNSKAFPVINRKVIESPAQKQQVVRPNLSVESNTDASLVSSPVLPASPPTSNNNGPSPPSRRSSTLPSTPREPGTPSYRERLENKLKILGSRYPTSPARSSLTPNSKKDKENGISLDKPTETESQTKTAKSVDFNKRPNSTPKDDVVTFSVKTTPSFTSPTGEKYDGLETRIKDLLARTLNPPLPSQGQHQQGHKDAAYQSSPSAELKAIKKLLEQGVAAASAAEERKREKEEDVSNASYEYGRVNCDLVREADQTEDLNFPELGGTVEEGQWAAAEGTSKESPSDTPLLTKARESPKHADQGIRLVPRSKGPVPAVFGSVSESTKDTEPAVACSTSEEILVQLDSFSQSTEFKVKSRRSASPRSVPREIKHNNGGAVTDIHKEVLDQTEPSREITEEPKKADKPSLSTMLERGAAPSNSQAEHAEDIKLTRAALSDKTASDNVQAKVGSGNLQRSGPEENGESDFSVEINKVMQEIESNEPVKALDGSDDVGSDCSEKEAKPSAVSRKNEPGQEQNGSWGDQNLQALAKKTPSVLNAALCRPFPSDSCRDPAKDRQSIEKKGSQSRTPASETSWKEVTPEKKTDASVRTSSSHDSSKSRENNSSPSSPEETSKVTTENLHSEVHSRRNVITDSSRSVGGNPDPEFQEDQDQQAGSDIQETTQTHLAEKSMLARVTPPAGVSEATVPEAAVPCNTSPNENKEATSPVDEATSSAKKNVSLQAPPSPNRHLYGNEPISDKVPGQGRDDITNLKKGRQDRKIRFRDPYPTPKPCRKPRSNEDIQRDHSCRPSKTDKQIKWKEPKGDLKRLLVAALDASLSRRGNACGALKVISKIERNKVVLVRTTGFLESLVFVITDEVSSKEPDLKEDARARAISCIYNVSSVKENRLILCTHPGLLECLVKTITEDRGEARMEACGVLAQLAKNPMCRDVMAGVDELLSTLASVLKGTIDPEENITDMLSQDVTEEEVPSSYSEMSSVFSEEHIPFPKTTASSKNTSSTKLRPNFSIRKQKSEMYDHYFELARLSACAALIHLSKQCSILDHFVSNMFLLESITQVAKDVDSNLHGKCLEILCNASRLPGNNTGLTRFPGMIDTLLGACSSTDVQDRVWALRTLQNMSSDAASKSTLATGTLFTMLINCVTSKNLEERHAAMATLLNLSTDPSAVVPITSTKNVLATLVYLAHNAESTADIRLMACNALATVGLWLQTVAGFGTIPEETRRVLLPSHKTTGWDIWE